VRLKASRTLPTLPLPMTAKSNLEITGRDADRIAIGAIHFVCYCSLWQSWRAPCGDSSCHVWAPLKCAKKTPEAAEHLHLILSRRSLIRDYGRLTAFNPFRPAFLTVAKW